MGMEKGDCVSSLLRMSFLFGRCVRGVALLDVLYEGITDLRKGVTTLRDDENGADEEGQECCREEVDDHVHRRVAVMLALGTWEA